MSLYGNRQEGSVTWDHVYNNEITSYSEENFIRYPSWQQTKLWLSLQKSRPKEKNVLAKWKNYLTSDQRNLELNSVILLPLIFTSHYLNNALNNIHERALRLIYNHHEKSFNSILIENNLKTIHKKEVWISRYLDIKFQNGLSLSIMNDIFIPRQNILISKSLRNFPREFGAKTIEDLNYGT